MFSGTVFSVGGHTIQLSSFYLLLAGMLLLAIAGFLLGLSRGRRVLLQRSDLTDELTTQLWRIANALERNADQSPDRLIAEASREAEFESRPAATARLCPHRHNRTRP
jgi:hypothetical protein